MLEDLVSFVTATRFRDVPPSAVGAAQAFLMDSLAVGVAGKPHPHRKAVVKVASGWGEGADARVLGDGLRLPAAAAAFVNAYQMHCLEFDCVHEQAVAHVMTAVAPAALAECERCAAPVNGQQLLTALVLGVEVASLLGLAATAPLTFFRPATVGVFGAAAAVGVLRGFDAARMRDCLGHALSQAAGTMQAHEEGKPTLPLQIAGAARAGLVAADLAAAGIPAPQDSLEGRYGYFRLFEESWDAGGLIDGLGDVWQVTRLSHKPWPSGRATHGGIEGVLQLRADGVTTANLAKLTLAAPPLIHQLVIRPPAPAMDVNYARLCFAYVGAVALCEGSVSLDHFSAERLRDPGVLAVAGRFGAELNAVSDPAAFVPQALTAELRDGSCRTVPVDAVPGSPECPLDEAACRAKADACLQGIYGGSIRGEVLAESVSALPGSPDASRVLDPVTGA
ncbi:MAG: MmgE/PrpD family protein [Gammaproteobacteria bacterium]|nr:MmgE/PrpD family protein [Gammaproteobacteria bacterium]MDE0364187.1 MmgE/PrpD family protein [Gammaproteobacteria bacterium]